MIMRFTPQIRSHCFGRALRSRGRIKKHWQRTPHVRLTGMAHASAFDVQRCCWLLVLTASSVS